jgi:hypothetical protein
MSRIELSVNYIIYRLDKSLSTINDGNCLEGVTAEIHCPVNADVFTTSGRSYQKSLESEVLIADGYDCHVE